MTLLNRLTLYQRLSLFLILGIVVGLGLLGCLSIQAINQVTQQVLDEHLMLAQVVADHLDAHLRLGLEELQRTAALSNINLEDNDPEPERQLLAETYRQLPLFSYALTLMDAQGVVVAREPHAPQVLEADLLQRYLPSTDILRSGSPSISDVQIITQTNQAIVVVTVPVRNSADRVVGFLQGAMDLSSPQISHLIGEITPGQTGYVQLMDSQGVVIISTRPEIAFQEADHLDLFLPLLQTREAKVAAGVYQPGEEHRYVVAFAPLRLAPWGVAVEQDEAEAFAGARTLRLRLLLISIVALVAALILVQILGRSVAQPLQSLVAASERIAAGDLSTPVPPLGRDEVGQLGRHFEAMRLELKASYEELEERVNRRTHELATLYAISRAAAHSLDLEEVLNAALEETLTVLDVESGAILLLEPDGETMTLRAHRGLSQDFVAAVQRIRVGESISGQAVSEGKPVILEVPDYPTERLSPFIVKEGFQILVSTPLIYKDQAVGALTLGTRRPRAFPPQELELLAAIGQQIGAAVENARLYNAEQRRAEEFRVISEVGRHTTSMLAVDELLQEIARLLKETLGYYLVGIALVEGDELVFKAGAGGVWEVPGFQPPRLKVGGKGITSWVAQSGKPLLVPDVSQEPRYYSLPEASEVRSELAVPLKTKGTVIGVLHVQSDRVDGFGESDLALLQSLAQQAAVAIQNAQLYQQATESASRLEAANQRLLALNRVGLKAQEAFQVEDIFEVVVEELKELGFDSAILLREGENLVIRHASVEPTALAAAEEVIGIKVIGYTIPMDTPALQSVVGAKETVFSADLLQPVAEALSFLADPGLNEALETLGVHRIITAPLIARDSVIGLLAIWSHDLEEDDVPAVTAFANQTAIAVENARLYEQVREERVEEQATLLQLSQELLAILEPDEIMRRTAQVAAEALYADCADLMLLDEGGQTFTLRFSRGREHLIGRLKAPNSGETLPGYTLQLRTPVIVEDTAREERFLIPSLIRENGATSALSAPLLAGEEAIGVLIVDTRELRQFTPEEAHFLDLIATQAGMALQRAALFKQAEERAQELNTLSQIARAVSSGLSLETTLETIYQQAQRIMPVDAFFISLYDKGAHRLDHVLLYDEGVRYPGQSNIPYEGTTVRQVIDTGEPVLINRDPARLDELSDLKRRVGNVERISASLMYAPLKVGDDVIGVISAQSYEPYAYSWQHLALLSGIASHAATAIHNARLYASEQRQRQRAEILREVAGILDSTLDVREVLQLLLEQLARLVEYDSACVMLLTDDELRVVADRGFRDLERQRQIVVSLEDPKIQKMLQRKGPLVIADTRTDPSWDKLEIGEYIRSWIGAPLLAGDRLIGLLNIDKAEPDYYTPEEASLVQAFAYQAAIAIENARLYEQVKDFAAELERKVEERTRELQKSEERLRLQSSALEAAANAIVITDREGRIVWANPASTRLTGYTLEETLGQNPSLLKSGKHDQAFYQNLWETILSGQVWHGELVNRRKDGSLYFEEQIITPVRDERGKISHFIAIKQDISERKRAEEELRVAKEAAEAASRAKSEFLATMSHELRTPLNSIIGFSQLLQKQSFGPLTERQAEYVGFILQSGRHLLSLINDVLDLSKVEADRMEITPMAYPLPLALDESLTTLRPQAEGKGLHLKSELPADLPSLWADPKRLRQVLYNLLSNAVKFTPEGGTVRVTAHVVRCQDGQVLEGPALHTPPPSALGDGLWALVRVIDTGAGIAPGDQARLFQPLQQLDSSLARQYEGTGLGLALSRRLVELQGGQLWLEWSEPGKGSSFTLALPLAM